MSDSKEKSKKVIQHVLQNVLCAPDELYKLLNTHVNWIPKSWARISFLGALVNFHGLF